jgi:hypothetical protein
VRARHSFMNSVAVLLLAVAVTGTAAAQSPEAYSRPADVTTIDGIVRAFYDVVSGPAGAAPDRARDESLHFEGARIGMSRRRTNGEPVFLTMDLAGYYERFGGVRSSAFHEWEIHRELQQFGNVAQVWSTYVASETPNGAPIARGINSIHLFHDGQRWWITGWIDERESEENPLPPRFLPPAG